MNDLTVKQVDFFGDELLAIQEQRTGQVYTAINYVLRGLGFDDYQIRYQREKWTEDKSVSKGVRKFSHPSESRGMQETYCIDIKRLPIALAKINITPKMENEMPELAKKLELYQDTCADVLAEAFLPKKAKTKNKASKQPSLSATNTAMKLIIPQLEAAGVDPVQRTYFLKDVYATVGINVPMIRVEQEKLYELTEIADVLGVYSKTDNPHAQAIGAIIGQLEIDEDNIVKTSFTRNGHTDISNQYKEPVLHQVQNWLNENGYPAIISSGTKKFSVFYKVCV